MMRSSMESMIAIVSEPKAKSRYAENGLRCLAFCLAKLSRFKKRLLVAHAHVGRELSCELVAQPQAHLEVPQTLAHAELRDALDGDVDLCARLRDQALGHKEVMCRANAHRDVASLTDEKRRFDLDEVGHHPFEADHEVPPSLCLVLGQEVTTEADLNLPE